MWPSIYLKNLIAELVLVGGQPMPCRGVVNAEQRWRPDRRGPRGVCSCYRGASCDSGALLGARQRLTNNQPCTAGG